jgi:hypothetical protein
MKVGISVSASPGGSRRNYSYSRTFVDRVTGEMFMRLILGMLLGALLLTAGAYYHDSMATSTIASGPNASEHRPMVNWDVVESNWNSFKVKVQEGWASLRARIDRV